MQNENTESGGRIEYVRYRILLRLKKRMAAFTKIRRLKQQIRKITKS